MPYSQTKNMQTDPAILKMINCCFQTEYTLSDVRIAELTEGFFNAAYEIGLPDGRELILKVAPPPEAEVMSCEKNIMYAEAGSMRLVREQTDVPVAKICAYDDTGTLCSSPYLFMEKLEGSSLSSVKKTLTPAQLDDIYFSLGRYTARINSLEGSVFGYYAQPESQGSDWYTVFRGMLEMAFQDAGKKQIDLAVSREEVFRALEQDREIFQDVTRPRFVHWDLWDGNILIKDGKITGLIDFERCLWGDPFMEVNFRCYNMQPRFLKGYGKERLTAGESRRCLWYDIYLFLLAAMEYDYRHYETRDSYHWAASKLQDIFQNKI